jgi:hypothetical protein
VQAGAPRTWHTAVVQSVDINSSGLTTPSIKVRAEDGVVYTMHFIGVHKVDLIPYIGIATAVRRNLHGPSDIAVGSTLRFAVDVKAKGSSVGRKAWIIDSAGVERKLLVTGVEALQDPK